MRVVSVELFRKQALESSVNQPGRAFKPATPTTWMLSAFTCSIITVGVPVYEAA